MPEHINGEMLKANDFQVNGSDVFISKTKTKGHPGMLLIKADFCGHCTRFIPTFNEVHKKIGKDFSMTSVEHTELSDSKLTSALNFRGFPTIKFFNQHGKIVAEHSGGRDTSSLLQEICKVYHKCYI